MIYLYRTYAKKPGFYEKSFVEKLEIYEETRFLAEARVSFIVVKRTRTQFSGRVYYECIPSIDWATSFCLY